MSLLTVLHNRRLILQLRSAVRESLCHRPRATVRSTRATAMAIGPCDFWRLAVDFELLDLHALSNVSAASTATNACVLQSANLRNLLQRKVEQEGNLESQNLRIDIGFEEMAALKHSLKIALHVYGALQNSLCFACRRSIPTEVGAQEYRFGLLQIWTLRWLFRSLDNCLHGTRRYLGRTALRCPDRWWCARCGHVVECLPSRCRMSFVASRCSLGPQCHCG